MRVAIIAPVKGRNIKKIGNQRVNSFDLLHFPKIFSPIKVARCHFQVGKMTHAFQVNLELSPTDCRSAICFTLQDIRHIFHSFTTFCAWISFQFLSFFYDCDDYFIFDEMKMRDASNGPLYCVV